MLFKNLEKEFMPILNRQSQSKSLLQIIDDQEHPTNKVEQTGVLFPKNDGENKVTYSRNNQ